MNPKKRTNNLVERKIEKELLVYDLLDNRALCLNETVARVWKLCDGTNSVKEIAETMSQSVRARVTEELVELAIHQLRENGLIETASEIDNIFNGVSRREIIRKIGFSSPILLPTIASLVAPKAIWAQSGCTEDPPWAPGCSGGGCGASTIQNCQIGCNGLSSGCTSGVINAVDCVPTGPGSIGCECVCA